MYRRSEYSSDNKTKETWKIINSTLRNAKKLKNSIVLNIDGNIITDSASISNQFASYFATVASDAINKNFVYNLSLQHTLSLHNKDSMYFYEV